MAQEIEYKYIVRNTDYRAMASESHEIAQGYLSRDPECVVRVRIRDKKGFLTVKGRNRPASDSDSMEAARDEFEYEIPCADARSMLAMCKGNVINKRRYIVPFGGYVWEVDEFHGHREGLVVAEIEVSDASEEYALPPFVGENVTGDPRYYNSNL